MTTLRDGLAYLTFPLLMGGFVALAVWGLGRGYDPASFGAGPTVLNFFVILAFERSWAHYFLPTVQLHNLHHAMDRRHQDSNYSGSSAIWDVLFGTFSHPDRCPLGPLGIESSPVPGGFVAQVLYPFRSQLAEPGPRLSAGQTRPIP